MNSKRTDLLDKCTKLDSRKATIEELSTVHSVDYIETIRQTEEMTVENQEKLCQNFEDIYVNKHSWEAALLSVIVTALIIFNHC